MVTTSLVLVAAAMTVWPGPRVRDRLGSLRGAEPGRHRVWRRRLRGRGGAVLAAGAVSGVALAWVGPGAAVAVLLLGTAVHVHVRSKQRTNTAVRTMARTAQALRAMAGDLRAGAHPAHAAQAAAQDADADVAAALEAMAMTARLGGEPEVGRAQEGETVGATALNRLRTAWSLARRHGLPLADVVDAVHRDVDARARLAAQLQARMAGPRASALMLAGLPVLGLLLGQAMGAEPLTVLATTAVGQVLFTVGAALVLGGVYWTSAITGRAAPR